MTYSRARKDFEKLNSIAELGDHLPIADNLQEFMETPTKAYAMGLYESSIGLWLMERRHHGWPHDMTPQKMRSVRAIADRHCLDVPETTHQNKP